MVLFFLTTLTLSGLGIVLLFALKAWELKTGKMLVEPLRPHMHHFFSVTLFWIERVIPTMARVYGREALRATLAFVHRSVAFLVLLMEHLLQQTLHIIRRSTDVQHRAAGEASVFLREVAEHKRKLLKSGRGQVRLRKE